MRGWGFTFLIIGVLAYVLSSRGIYFLVLHLFGTWYNEAAITMAVIGLIMIIASYAMQPRAPRPPESPQ